MYTISNIISIEISSVDLIFIIRIEPEMFEAIKLEIYYRYPLYQTYFSALNTVAAKSTRSDIFSNSCY